MLTRLLIKTVKAVEITAYFQIFVKGSSPTTGTRFKEPVIQTDCGLSLCFQGILAFKSIAAYLISKHKKQKENAENANRNANRAGRQYETDIRARVRAPPDLRKERTIFV